MSLTEQGPDDRWVSQNEGINHADDVREQAADLGLSPEQMAERHRVHGSDQVQIGQDDPIFTNPRHSQG